MTVTALTIIGGIVTAVVTGSLGFAVARLNADTTRASAITAPYGELAKRVGDLERADEEKSRVLARLRDHLEVVIRDRDALVAYVKALSTWVAAGALPPAPPIPTHLHDLLDPAAFDIAHITERTTTTTTTYVTPSEGDPS
jgi:hypothetical protein